MLVVLDADQQLLSRREGENYVSETDLQPSGDGEEGTLVFFSVALSVFLMMMMM